MLLGGEFLAITFIVTCAIYSLYCVIEALLASFVITRQNLIASGLLFFTGLIIMGSAYFSWLTSLG